MKHDIAKKDSFDISYYQDYLNRLYFSLDNTRSYEDTYGYLVRTSGYLCKALRTGSCNHTNFVLTISWLFSLSTKLNIDIQDAFCRKYPGICPNCLASQCVCFSTSKMPSKRIPAYKMNEEMYFRYETLRNTVKKSNLDWAVKNITDIFAVNQIVWYFHGAWRHIAKLYEETAEIHEAVSDYKKGEKPLSAVAEEVADVFAWIMSVWGIVFPNQSLDKTFVDYYFDGCPVCKSFPCKCKMHNGKPTGLVDYNRLTNVKEKLDELSKILPDYKEDMDELKKSYEYVLHTQNEPTAKVVVSQTKDVVEKIRSGTSTQDDVTSKSESFTLKKYDVFLSYSTIDKDEARKLEAFLTKNKINVFLSEKEVKPSSKWEIEIKEALRNSSLLCVLATPNSLKSEWVITEWGVAWIQDIKLLPVLLHCSVGDLPERLKAYQAIDYHDMDKIVDVIREEAK